MIKKNRREAVLFCEGIVGAIHESPADFVEKNLFAEAKNGTLVDGRFLNRPYSPLKLGVVPKIEF